MATTKPNVTTTRTVTVATLGLLFLLAVWTIWIKSIGMFTSIFDLSQKSTLPYSDTPYRKSYTGVAAFDVYLGNFMCFFMTIAERKSDDLYLFWVWMAGQFGPLFGIMMLETVRDGHKSKHPYIELAITGVLFQNLGIGPVLPFMFIINTLVSEVANAQGPHQLVSLIRAPIKHVNLIPWVLVFAFIFPTVMWMLPFPTTLQSAHGAQGWVAAWQFFPAYCAFLLGGLYKLFNWMDRVSGRNDAMGQDPIKTEEGKTIRYFYAAKTTYGILFTACALVHSTVMAIVLIPGFAAAIPGIPNFESSTCSSVFGASVLPNRGDKTLMDSLLNFLQWEQYIASEAAIFWVANLVRNAGPNGWGSVKGGAIGFFAMMTFYAVIAGPTGAAIMGLWERDQIVVDTLIKEARDWAKDQKVEKSQ